MTTYNQNTFRELIFSKDPDKIEEGMELLKSTHPQTIEDIFAEVGWDVMDEDALYERLKEHAYLTLYLLGVMHDFEVQWVVELELLEIYEIELRKMPDIIENLRNLTELIFFDNQLMTLPDWIGNLTNLTDLYLDKNQLTTLPDSIGNLTNLTYLHLSDDLISESELERIQALLPDCKI